MYRERQCWQKLKLGMNSRIMWVPYVPSGTGLRSCVNKVFVFFIFLYIFTGFSIFSIIRYHAHLIYQTETKHKIRLIWRHGIFAV